MKLCRSSMLYLVSEEIAQRQQRQQVHDGSVSQTHRRWKTRVLVTWLEAPTQRRYFKCDRGRDTRCDCVGVGLVYRHLSVLESEREKLHAPNVYPW